MGIRVPGSKSRAYNPQQAVRRETTLTDVLPINDDILPDNPVETDQSNIARNVAATHPISEIDSTRASRAWSRILPALILLAVILVFVFQNLGTTTIAFLMFSGTIPVALALIIAAALGGLLVLTIGSIRILQLRKAIHSRADS